VPAQLHLAKDPLALHLLLERLQRLIDIVIPNKNLHLAACSFLLRRPADRGAPTRPRAVVRAEGASYNIGPRPRQSHFAPHFGTTMAILKIARMGHPVLLQHCAPVPDPGAPEIRRLVADMIETMEDAPGVGLAAPQVYVPLRLFVFRIPGERRGEDPLDLPVGTSVLINPEVALLSDERVLCWEGCLSIPDLRAAVPRSPRIRYRGVDCDGVMTEREVTGFHADVIQHEYDHLDGILYPMRVQDFSLFGYVDELARARAAEQGDDAE
jgi:peptide deformylase